MAGYGKADMLFEQIRDLELMQRNVEECYSAECGAPIIDGVSLLSRGNHRRLDGLLINRVFGYLAGTPEYERFAKAHRALIQRPDYMRLHKDELFAEYMRLLKSGRTRLLTQLNAWQGSFAESGWPQPNERFLEVAQAAPVKRLAGKPALRTNALKPSIDSAVFTVHMTTHLNDLLSAH